MQLPTPGVCNLPRVAILVVQRPAWMHGWHGMWRRTVHCTTRRARLGQTKNDGGNSISNNNSISSKQIAKQLIMQQRQAVISFMPCETNKDFYFS